MKFCVQLKYSLNMLTRSLSIRRFSAAQKQLSQANEYFNELLTDTKHHNKCVGVAKNFFTNAMIANKENPDFM